MELKRGIDKAVAIIVKEIKAIAQPVDTKEAIAQVASISANNDFEIGDLIANAMDKVGNEGVITVEESNGIQTELEVVEGMQFDKGYASPYMVTDKERMEASFDDPFILITDKKISAIKDILPVLEQVVQANKGLVIIAEDIEGEALATLVVNKLRGTFNCLAVKAPGFGDRRKAILEDIAILTGAELISEEKGLKLEETTIDQLGTASKVKSTKDETTIVEGKGKQDAISGRVDEIKRQIAASESSYDQEKLQERLAKLSGGVAVIKVGAATETELKEKKHRVEDALSATRAAVEEGIVAGGGTTFINLIPVLEAAIKKDKTEQRVGMEIVLRSLEAPTRQIANNCGLEGSVIVEKVKSQEKDGIGYNARDDKFEDMVSNGIVDPAKVVVSAIMNGASIAGTALTTEVLIADEPEEGGDANAMAGGMGGMGGGMPGMM